MDFHGQLAFEDLLLYEMVPSCSSVGCRKDHLWKLFKLVRNPPIDFQGFSTVSCSFVPFECSTGQKKPFIKWVLRVVCATLHLYFASYTIILSSNDRFWQFNGQWVFEDLLLHEIKAFLPDFGCCKNHLWRSLKLVRNPPIDVGGFSTDWCSLVSFKCSTGQTSFFIKWAPRVVWTSLLVFLL